MSEIITFRGNKEVWQRFVNNVKSANKEVWEVLEPLLAPVIHLDYIKIKRCVEAALAEYNENRIIDQIVFTRESPDTDGKFIPVYNCGIVDEAFFKEDKGEVSHCPILPALGSRIAAGERNHLIQEILKIKKRDKIGLPEINISFLSKEGASFRGDTTIFISSKFSHEAYLAMMKTTRIKYEKSIAILGNNIKIIFVPEKILGNKIIFIENLSCQWIYTRSFNYITGKPEILRIDIDPKPKEKKVQVLASTLGKLEILSPEGIKIYEVNR